MKVASSSLLQRTIVVALCFGLTSFSTALAENMPKEMIIVHPFQWTYNSIAKECKEVFGPAGYEAVQISPPSEHIARTDVWWSVYQPVSFTNFTTQTGNEAELKNMIATCKKAGVKIFADAVINHRASNCQNGCKGLSGAEFDQYRFVYPDMTYDDFHHIKCRDGIVYSKLDTVRNCMLLALPDINTERPETQTKIANYLKTLLKFGVFGFRIDAAKHMEPESLKTILKAAGNPPVYSEVIAGRHDATKTSMYTLYPSALVTEFAYSRKIMGDIDYPERLLKYDQPKSFTLSSDQAEVFVTNHDNERGSAGSSYLNYTYGPKYYLAQSFMVAFPFGRVRQVYSGYEFKNHDDPAPMSVAPCGKGWNCEHRNSLIMNAVGFARATRGTGVTDRGSDNKVIWFSRGNKGFYALNADKKPVTKTFKTQMKDGTYCEILQQPNRCGGQKIKVKKGMATITIPAMSAAAICQDKSKHHFCGK